MKYLKRFNESSNSGIENICLKYGIDNYTINADGSIDVTGDVDLSGKNLKQLPLTFRKVTGYFSCSNNQLTTLTGGPERVGGYFNCINNKLTNNYCDTEILGGFYTSLKQDGMIFDYNKVTNYNEWRKLYKRKMILDDIFNM